MKNKWEKIKKFGSFNVLPWNIIFKYLVKWLYYKIQTTLKNIYKNDELKKKDIEKLYQNFIKFWY